MLKGLIIFMYTTFNKVITKKHLISFSGKLYILKVQFFILLCNKSS